VHLFRIKANVPVPNHRDPGWIKASRFAAVGVEFGTTIVAGVLVGYYLDQWLGTTPLLTMVLTVGAMFGAIYRLVWMLNRER
jgi:F0F1-type ATP synthase assembly protein I